MTTTATEPLHLNRLEIDNFLRVSALTVDADGNHVVLSGPNGSGKTSCLDAVWAALGGKPARDMPEPIKRGKTRASVKLDLGEYKVERVWTDKGSRLVVTAADGSRPAKPQALLDGLLGKYSLDPIAFLDRRPIDQVDDVLSLAGVEAPVHEVYKVTGETDDPVLLPRDGESADQYLMRLSADETGLYYLRRRDASRQLAAKEASLTEQGRQLELLGGPLAAKEQESSIADTLREIEQLQGLANARSQAHGAVQHAQAQYDAAMSKLQGLRDQERRIEDEMIELMKRVEVLKSTRQGVLGRIAKGEEVTNGLARDLDEARQHADNLPDHTEQITGLRHAVGEWERTNQKIAKRRAAAEQLERLGADTASSKAEHDRLDQVLAGLRDLRAHLLDGVDLGVPGLEIGGGELRLNGVSFRQASQAEQIRVAAAVAMRQQPRLRLLRVDEAERLDKSSMQLLLELANRNDWQVVCARVSDAEQLRVEIVEGNP